MKKITRKLTRTGTHSYTIIIPKEIIKKFGWRERQKLELSEKGKSIVIKDWKPKKKK